MAGYKAKFLLREQCCSGTAAQEGGGVFTPGSIQNHADVALGDVVSGRGGGRLVIGLDDLSGLFQPI